MGDNCRSSTWRFLGDDWSRGGTRCPRAHLVHRLHPELILLSLLQVRNHHLRVAHRLGVHLCPVASSRLHLDDIALQLAVARVPRPVPVEGDRVRRDAVDDRLSRRTTRRCERHQHQQQTNHHAHTHQTMTIFKHTS